MDDLELRLVAYAPVVSHGFALPLFGQHDRANTLYVAGCSPSGDHRGMIAGFEVYEAELRVWLPAQRRDRVRVGAPWLDVFLWNDQVLVGDADALWGELAPLRSELERLAPLSLLDAAMNAAAGERDALAPAAMTYVAQRFGAERALQWREGTLRRHVGVLVRRVLPEFREASTVAGHALSADAGSAHLHLSGPLVTRLREAAALDDLLGDMKRLAGAMDLKFDLSSEAPAVSPVERPALPAEPTAPEPLDAPPGAALVLAIGRRAREISRHIGEPGWVPGDVRRELHDQTRLIHVMNADDPRALEKLAAAYDVVVALADDRIDGTQLTPRQRAVLERTERLGTLRILAPALPEDHPARSLVSSRAVPVLDDWRFNILLDTAQARSPFWWGNPKRSLDRRIADIISSAACLCLSERVAEGVRMSRTAEPPLMVLAMDLEQGRGRHSDPEWGLSSESTWFEPGRPAARGRTLFKHSVEVFLQKGGGARRALLECRSTTNGFGEFAVAVINDLFGDEPGRVRHGPDMLEPPTRLMHALDFPEQAFAFHTRTAGAPLKLLVTAETPTLTALLLAQETGWRVIRYTDRETLRDMIHSDGEPRTRNVPAEVRLKSISTSDVNRRVATRGVDSRDIIRLTPDQLHEWIDRVHPEDRNQMRGEIRPVRTSQEPTAGEHSAFAVRRRRISDGRFPDDPTLRALSDVLGSRSRELTDRSPYKRAADLDACWTPPAEGLMRFALADGDVPPLMVQLRRDEIVLQTFFIIDGDWSAPALFRSRVFGVWAAATLSRSSSWMSRFSVGVTFAGFPIPPRFRVVGVNGTGCAIESEDRELLSLAMNVEGHIERITNAGGGSAWKAAQHSTQLRELSAARALEARILASYDLPSDADDLSILERLVAMNALLARP